MKLTERTRIRNHPERAVPEEVAIEEWNAKARRGAPTGPDDDKPHALGSAGVIELREP